MAFRVSPGVNIKEIDLTTIAPAVATTPGGYAGHFPWGPANEVVSVTRESELVNTFGKPDDNNYVDFFTAANFLSYGNNLQVVRAIGASATNSQATKQGITGVNTLLITNSTNFGASAGLSGSTPATSGVLFASKYPGVLGNSLKVITTVGPGTTGASLANAAVVGATYLDIYSYGATVARYMSVNDEISFTDGTVVTVKGIGKGNSANTGSLTDLTPTYGDFLGGFTSGQTLGAGTKTFFRVYTNELLTADQIAGATITIKSAYAKYIGNQSYTTPFAADAGGSGDAVNILVLDKDGKWTGTQNALLEKFEGCSRAYDARNYDGSSNYYRTVVNDKSKYVWALSGDLNSNGYSAASVTAWAPLGPALGASSGVGGQVNSLHLTGATSAIPTVSERWANGWNLFNNTDAVDVSLLPTGNASATLSQLIVQNLCEKRLDCVAFVSPAQSDVENKQPYEALSNIKTFRDSTFNINSSYAVIDSGWKYQLDTYNNVVRLIPLNGDIAGLVARTEFTDDAWFSPAGFNRGQIKNVVKLAYPAAQEAHRDELYTRQVNPVVSFPGQGVILFGDKTAQTRPSAFDRINVRRLFIVLEKSISTAAKFFLFEQNDSFTRAQFKNLVVPFLQTIQARRGITDFKVVCDDSNNTAEVIDRGEFVADIFVKPTRSINFIQLNFVATKTGAAFTETA